MARYITVAEEFWERSNPVTSMTVNDHVATDTGLLDKHGRKIMRLPNEMGFHAKFD